MKKRKIDPIAVGIKNMIADRGFVQKAVALRAGYTSQQFNDMLNGRKVIKASDITPIANALGVSVQDGYDAGLAQIATE